MGINIFFLLRYIIDRVSQNSILWALIRNISTATNAEDHQVVGVLLDNYNGNLEHYYFHIVEIAAGKIKSSKILRKILDKIPSRIKNDIHKMSSSIIKAIQHGNMSNVKFLCDEVGVHHMNQNKRDIWVTILVSAVKYSRMSIFKYLFRKLKKDNGKDVVMKIRNEIVGISPALEEMISRIENLCASCDNTIKHGAKFCSSCGVRIPKSITISEYEKIMDRILGN